MTKHVLYFAYVMKHKWFVFVAGLKTGAPLWRLIIHDWTKFLPSEWLGYANYFYGGQKTDESKERFNKAWLLHQRRNKHHWQYWIYPTDNRSDPYQENTYPKWVMQSPDGVGELNIIQEYTGPHEYDRSKGINLPDLAISKDDSARYSSVMRLLFAANRLHRVDMPDKYIREMVADWAGAGRAINGRWDLVEWFEKNQDKMHLPNPARVRELVNRFN